MKDKLNPQAETVLAYLQRQGSATHVEVQAVHKITRLAARIHELREAGHQIRSETKNDPSGTRYTRYFLDAKG